MGIHPMRDPRHCPRCSRDLSLAPQPERVKVPGFPAEVAYGTDPVCQGRWHIWDKTSPLRAKAQPYVDGQEAPGCAPKDADTLVTAEVGPDTVGTGSLNTDGFHSAAQYHGLPDIDERLAAAGGDPEAAWQEWTDEYRENGWEG
jgi:hypothetical protein